MKDLRKIRQSLLSIPKAFKILQQVNNLSLTVEKKKEIKQQITTDEISWLLLHTRRIYMTQK